MNAMVFEHGGKFSPDRLMAAGIFLSLPGIHTHQDSFADHREGGGWVGNGFD
jgi:hypothetical protein